MPVFKLRGLDNHELHAWAEFTDIDGAWCPECQDQEDGSALVFAGLIGLFIIGIMFL